MPQNKTHNFKCEACGASLSFDPNSQGMKCPYCGYVKEIEAENKVFEEYDLFEGISEDKCDWGREQRVIKCKNCGAETIVDANAVSDRCAFCDSPNVFIEEETAGIKPESLVPFKITDKKAKELFRQWLNKRFFAPKDAKSNHQAAKMTGVYIPHWTYDSDTFSSYTGEGGTYYYVTETDWVERDGKRQQVSKQVRKVRWWPTSGTFSKYFDDVLVNASKKMEPRLMDKLQPFHLNQLVEYKPEFLSGFQAEKYTIGIEEGWDRARNVINRDIYDGVVRQINADTVRNISINTKYNSIRYKHLLIPIWVSAFTYKNKVYNFLVNGQTGEVQGHAPVSALKVALVILLTLGLAAAFYFIFSYLQ